MNLLMIAPLCDSRGQIRYHIGAQVDVSGLVKDCTDLESFQQLVTEYNLQHDNVNGGLESQQDRKDEFQELSEMFNMGELETVRKWGGRMHRDYQEEDDDRNGGAPRPRLLLKEPTADTSNVNAFGSRGNGRLSGIYQNVRVESELHL